MNVLRWVAGGLCALALLPAAARAENAATELEEGAEGTLQVRVIGWRLMVRCDLSSKAGKRIPVHLLVEFDEPGDFELVGPAAQALEIESGDIVTAHFPGFALHDLPAKSVGDDRMEMYRKIAKYWSIDLGDVACAGRIGYAVLKPFRVALDLARSEMKLTPAKGAPPAAEDPDAVTVPLSIESGIPWFGVQAAAGKKNGMFALATSAYDTMVSQDLAAQLGHAAGDIGSVIVGRHDFAPFVAFRPAVLDASHSSGAIGATGLNLLKCFRMELDPVAGTLRVKQTAPPSYPVEDFDYFKAMVTSKADPVEEHLKKYPKVRLSPEAADLLLLRRIDTAVEKPEDLRRAIDWTRDTTVEELRATKALDVMDVLQGVNLPDFEIYAGELGLEKGRVDRDSNAAHKIHGRLGELKLDKGMLDKAKEHLMAAVFGLQLDGPINYNLGVLFEKQGKLERAFSRYVQASITKEAAARGWNGLKRVHPQLGKGDTFSIATLEHHIQGRVPNYGSAARFKPTQENSTNRVVLAELFTNPMARPHIAPELAFDAAIAYFPRENVAILEHHLGAGLVSAPALDAAKRHQVPPTAAVLDGTVKFGLAGRIIHKEDRYDRLKTRVLDRLKVDTPYKLDLSAEIADGAVKGEVRVAGPAAQDCSIHVILVEKALLYPGECFPDKQLIAVHHMVSRAALLEGAKGARFEPANDAQSVSFSRTFASIGEEIEGVLKSIEEQEGAQFSLRPTQVDPDQTSVVAYLRNDGTGEVLQAAQVEPKRPGKADPGEQGK